MPGPFARAGFVSFSAAYPVSERRIRPCQELQLFRRADPSQPVVAMGVAAEAGDDVGVLLGIEILVVRLGLLVRLTGGAKVGEELQRTRLHRGVLAVLI